MSTEFDKIASEIASRHFDGIISLEPITGKGTVNSVYLAITEDGKSIIRLNNYRANDEFAKERWCMLHARNAGVNVATSIAVGTHNEFNYSVQSYNGSTHGEDIKDQLSVWRFLGESTAKFHQVKVSGFGDNLADFSNGNSVTEWAGYLRANINAFNSESFEGLTERQQAKVAQKFESLAKLTPIFGLCHGDLCPRNVVMDENGQMTIIDWGCAHAHITPHYDFVELLRMHKRNSLEVQAFIDGYGLKEDSEALLDEVEIVLALCHYDLIRWARDCAPEEVDAKTADFLRLANRIS
jgi:Ser/Thr protein kinase RdoA (MazF antagonist)